MFILLVKGNLRIYNKNQGTFFFISCILMNINGHRLASFAWCNQDESGTLIQQFPDTVFCLPRKMRTLSVYRRKCTDTVKIHAVGNYRDGMRDL